MVNAHFCGSKELCLNLCRYRSWLWSKKEINTVYRLHVVHLIYISSLNWIHMGGTESSEIRHKTKINIQKKNQLIGRKKKRKKHEGLSKHLSAVFVSRLWWIYYYHMRLLQPKGNGAILSKSFSEKNPPDGLGGHHKVNTSRLVNAWVMS